MCLSDLDPTYSKGTTGQILGGLTGENAANAAKEAAGIQADAALAQAEATKEATAMSIEAQKEAREQARADLAPFVQRGAGYMGAERQAVAQSQQLFNDPTSIMQNPMFAAIQEDVRRQTMQNAAASGRLGTGGTLQALETNALRTGFDVLNSERQAQLQNAGFLANLVGQGQSAAAGQGATAIQSGQGISSALMRGNQIAGNQVLGAANAQAAGLVGAANAQQQGLMNLVNMGATIYNAIPSSSPAPTGGA